MYDDRERYNYNLQAQAQDPSYYSGQNANQPQYDPGQYPPNSQYAQYPQYPPQQRYPPQQQPLPPPQGPKKMSGALIAAIVIIVVFCVVILPIIAGVLFLWSSGVDDGAISGVQTPKVSTQNPEERPYGWTIKIVAVSGGTFRIEDANFKIIDHNEIRLYSQDVSECSPPAFMKGDSRVYAIPSWNGDGTVDDGTMTINAFTDLANYENCSIAYIDQDNNEKVSSGDTIYIYKDTNNDGTNDTLNGYSFELLYRDEMVICKSL